jgi:hypothetical protein
VFTTGGNLESGGTTMYPLSDYGVQEMEVGGGVEVNGGNPAVPYGIALAGAFGWGFRWGYNVAGPWLVAHF